MSKYGHKQTPETREKIRQLKLGKPRLFSYTPEETRRKMSESKKGNTFCRGYKHSEETRARMREGWKKRKAAARAKAAGVAHLTPEEAFKRIVDAAQAV